MLVKRCQLSSPQHLQRANRAAQAESRKQHLHLRVWAFPMFPYLSVLWCNYWVLFCVGYGRPVPGTPLSCGRRLNLLAARRCWRRRKRQKALRRGGRSCGGLCCLCRLMARGGHRGGNRTLSLSPPGGGRRKGCKRAKRRRCDLDRATGGTNANGAALPLQERREHQGQAESGQDETL